LPKYSGQINVDYVEPVEIVQKSWEQGRKSAALKDHRALIVAVATAPSQGGQYLILN
jgi:hypothetical protein